MRNPKKSEKSKESLEPLVPSNFSKNISEFYEKLHELDVKYTSTVYATVQKYTLLRIFSKVVGIISNGPALPLFFILYGLFGNPSPLTFAGYMVFWVLLHEFTIKSFFGRKRPATAGKQLGSSFPSSHSFSSGFIILITLVFAFTYKIWLIVFALINAANRPALGVHYIADVIAGLAIGLLAGAGWVFILRTVVVALP